ncbi:transposase [Chlorobaculum thiosulfatiphilum]|uniref:transposase n=1 Tax=Chlorobaculum thiosulfatiphilum TaxID=115852 RepID=UPI001FE32B88|nr:transposase [Chlorobaculum thiosulfatiphilum]
MHDCFHISKYLNEAVEVVRRKAFRKLDSPIGSKYIGLRNPKNLREQQQIELNHLLSSEFKTAQAWALKNLFWYFWQLCCADAGSFFLEYWPKRGQCGWLETVEYSQRASQAAFR